MWSTRLLRCTLGPTVDLPFITCLCSSTEEAAGLTMNSNCDLMVYNQWRVWLLLNGEWIKERWLINSFIFSLVQDPGAKYHSRMEQKMTLYWAKWQKHTKHSKWRMKMRNWGERGFSLFAGGDHCGKSFQATKGVFSNGECDDSSKGGGEAIMKKRGFQGFHEADSRQITTQVTKQSDTEEQLHGPEIDRLMKTGQSCVSPQWTPGPPRSLVDKK